MGKRVDKDPTMELSTSQLVPDAPRADASVWKQAVVGSENFGPPAKKTDRRALVILAFFVLFTAAAAAIYLALG